MALADRAVYATQPVQLEHQLDGLLRESAPGPVEGEIVALIVPDSNRLDGGAVAAEAYKLLEGRHYDTVILVSPSHDGAFDRLSICRVNEYRTPLGPVPVDDALRNELCDEDDDIFIDDRGHYHTEGADVQLPFLQKVLGTTGGEGADEAAFSIVPIVMGTEQPAYCRELGQAIGEVMYGKRALIIASADLLAAEEDALERFRTALEAFDTSALMHLLGSEQLRIEGMGAVITAVLAAERRRATSARVLRVKEPGADEVGAMACVLWRQ